MASRGASVGKILSEVWKDEDFAEVSLKFYMLNLCWKPPIWSIVLSRKLRAKVETVN